MGSQQGAMPQRVLATLLLEMLRGAPDRRLGLQGLQAELAPDRPPDRDQLSHHRHQRLLRLGLRAVGQRGGQGNRAGFSSASRPLPSPCGSCYLSGGLPGTSPG